MSGWQNFLESLGAALRLTGVLAIAAIAFAAFEFGRSGAQLKLTEQQASRFFIVSGGAATDLQKTLALEQKAAGDQLAATAATLKQSQTDLADTDAAIQTLNRTLASAGGTIDKLNGAIGTLDTAIEANSGQMVAIEKQAETDLADFDVDEQGLRDTMSAATGTIAQANKLLVDPSIPDDLVQLHTIVVHTAATSTHVDAATGDLADAIHRETRPASFAVKTAGFIIDGASKFGSILAGFVK